MDPALGQLSGKHLYAVCNGLSRKIFGKDPDCTHEFLRNALFQEIEADEEAINNFMTAIENLLIRAAAADFDVANFRAFIMANNASFFSDEQLEAILNFWRSEKSKIHDRLYLASQWLDSPSKSVDGFRSLTWRIDLKAVSQSVDSSNEASAPSALIQLTSSSQQAIRFEMTKAQLSDFINVLSQIEPVFLAK